MTLMEILELIGGILLLITSILIICVVMLQESRQSGLSGVITGGSSDSYYGKNRGRTRDAKLARATKIAAVAFFLLTIAVNLVAIFVA